jgi:hypothetical protein
MDQLRIFAISEIVLEMKYRKILFCVPYALLYDSEKFKKSDSWAN